MISDSRIKVVDKMHRLDKTKAKLVGWRASSLSLFGLVVLARSMLQTLHTHQLVVGDLSKTILTKIEALSFHAN